MNARDDIDLLMARWLGGSAPVAAPVAVHVEAMASVRKTRQNARWSAVVRTRFAAPGGQPTIRLFSIVGVAAMLMAGSVAMALSAGSPNDPTPSAKPEAAPSSKPTAAPSAKLTAAPKAALPAAIAGVLPADFKRALEERQFTCTTHFPEPDERFRVECNKGVNYSLVWRGRDPTSVYYIVATVTGVSESYAASLVGSLYDVCAPDPGGLEEWAFSNIHTGGETTIGPIRLRITVVSEGTWRIEIRSA